MIWFEPPPHGICTLDEKKHGIHTLRTAIINQ